MVHLQVILGHSIVNTKCKIPNVIPCCWRCLILLHSEQLQCVFLDKCGCAVAYFSIFLSVAMVNSGEIQTYMKFPSQYSAVPKDLDPDPHKQPLNLKKRVSSLKLSSGSTAG